MIKIQYKDQYYLFHPLHNLSIIKNLINLRTFKMLKQPLLTH